MHKNTPFQVKNFILFWGGGIAPFPNPSPVRGGVWREGYYYKPPWIHLASPRTPARFTPLPDVDG